MEFRKREVPKKFRPRKVKPREPRPAATANGLGPNLSDMKGKIATEFHKAGEHPPEFFDDVVRPRKKTVKTLTISFKCEIFEMADFNKLDMLAPAPSIDRQYKMEDGTRTYVYAIDQTIRVIMFQVL